MDADRHARIAELFEAACELDGPERAAFLDRVCAGDDALRTELEQLLEHDANPHEQLSTPAGGHAGVLRDALRDAEGGADREAVSGAAAPTRIGPYRLLEKLGEGGMGEVHLADQLEPIQRRVALKLIKRGMDSAQVVARFEAERQALARMSNPHVAQVFDAGTADDGRPYFVMEHVAGEPITDACDRRKLSTRARVELFLGVCDGVQHAHQKGIIHRDLKPSNLLVTLQDGVATPKVIDFGVARATTGRLAERTLHTLQGQVVGTLDYMSPEQADPTGVDVDTRSDIYSLGVVLYQLVSGLLPFDFSAAEALPLSEVRRAILEKEPPTPSTRLGRETGTAPAVAARRGTDARTLVRQLHGDLDRICLKALEKDPAQRYASASELADDLRRYLAHEPVLAARPSALDRVAKFVRRNRLAVASGGVVLAALVAGTVGIVTWRIEAETNAARADAERENVQRLSGSLRQLDLDALVEDARALWPPSLELVPACDAWLRRAEALVATLEPAPDGSHPGHRHQLEALRASALPADDGDPTASGDEPTGGARALSFASAEDALWHDQLVTLVDGLEALADPETGLIAGTDVPEDAGWSVTHRRDLAAPLTEQTLTGDDAQARWAEAVASIANRDECPAYDGLELAPQLGLLPIRRDPDSGLWEFAHLLSGEPATRDPATGRIVPTGEMGIVFVLVPRGTFVMGSQTEDPRGDNYDDRTIGMSKDEWHEGPPTQRLVEPFFLAKYEMTRGQWARCGGALPYHGPPGEFPVELVQTAQCVEVLNRVDLVLPTERQWEYAARAGADTPWWSGPDEVDLEGAANLFDRSVVDEQPGRAIRYGGTPVPWNDEFPETAPVGSFAPNAFGLYDVHGNVAEFCFYYRGRNDAPESELIVADFISARGGGYQHNAFMARSAYRTLRQNWTFSFPALGLRPARAVAP